MKSLLFVLFSIASVAVFGQDIKPEIPTPDAKAKELLKSSKELKDMVLKQTGIPFEQWKMVNELGVSHSYSDECYYFKNKSPRDLADYAWNYETAPDKDGMKKKMQVFIYFRRSVASNTACVPLNEYRFSHFYVTKPQDAGYPTFSSQEIMDIMTDYLKANPEDVFFRNYITIDKLKSNPERTNWQDKDNATLSMSFSGEYGIFNEDYTVMAYQVTQKETDIIMTITKRDGKWVATGLDGQYYTYSAQQNEYKYTPEDIRNEVAVPFQHCGFEGIFMKKTTKPKPEGMNEQLMKRVDAFYSMVLEKENNLTYNDIEPFLFKEEYRPASRSDQEFNFKSKTDNVFRTDMAWVLSEKPQLSIHSYQTTNQTNAEGEGVLMHSARVATQVIMHNYPVKKGVVVRKKPTGTEKRQESYVWIYKNGEWYVDDINAAIIK